jgi:ribosomal protein S18 acetylase RimI-like enzyme
VTTSSLQVVRAAPGLVWRALDDGQAVATIRAHMTPDSRWHVGFETFRADACRPLLDAVAGNTGSDLLMTVRESDPDALARFTRAGFEVSRREHFYMIPTDPAVTGLTQTEAPEGTIIISAARADEEELRLLDDALRQDVPGADGWKWDPGDFAEETYDSGGFNPDTYLVAADVASGDYVGLVRVWDNPRAPRLGLVGVVPSHRRRGLARVLLARAFRVMHEDGKKEVSAEADETNTASVALLTSLGARRAAGIIELVWRRPGT